MGKTVVVNYFALFREQSGLSRENCATDCSTLAELYEELSRKHGFSLRLKELRVAKNDEFCAWESSFNSGDEIVFIPPVAGG
ncbi:MAG: MoaD/ThiS family protein [Candidatus Obscuribacterales bacterium]|nr:MoaD/ThiS family protein [Candidatus Obscuribacterales bacterium]